jgi:hypothetical protein
MDVFCAGMYRSCSTWQYNICAELVERKAGGERLGFIGGPMYEPFGSPSQSTWRVLKTHDGHDLFSAALRQGRARAVYARRDIRDVVFSLMHKWSLSFDEIVAPNGLLEACFAADRFWPSLPHVLCQSYERITADPSTAVRAIAEHLSIRIADAEADELSFEFSVTKNKERARALAADLLAGGVDLANRENHLRYDPQSLLHWNHLRDCSQGGWKNLASPGQKNTLAELCGSWLVEHGYEPDM